MTDNNNAMIYGVKVNDKIHYIGKKSDEKLTNSSIKMQYFMPELRNVFITNDKVEIVNLKLVNEKWYDEKLLEILKKHKENNPLVNAQWMLDGKRGFWQDKKRDAHTLSRLSESKHKRIVQYDINGCHVKTWNSIKEVAIKIFNNYQVINGSAKTPLYSVLKGKTNKSRFKKNSYWFKEEELLKLFYVIPTKIHLDYIKKRERKIILNKKTCPNLSKHTVIQYDDNNNKINTFDNVFIAADKLNISFRTIRSICNNKIIKPRFNLKYGCKLKSINHVTNS